MAELADRKPLLPGSCPGCKVDRVKEDQIGVPYKNLSYIWFVSLCTALPISSLFPFVYFMIRDFHIAKREEDIGFYAGFVGNNIVIFNILFGLSTSFWMAIVTRFLLGCFNSLLGTIRAYAAEICKDEYRALALSVVSTSRGIGLIIGPAIGGFFAQETLHTHGDMEEKKPDSSDMEVSSGVSDGIGGVTEDEEHRSSSKASLWKNWPLMSTIIVYCVFSLQEIAYNEVFSLWAVSDKKYGGLSFSSQDVGEVLAISGMFCRSILHIVLNIASVLRNALSVSVVTGIFILINNAVPQHQRAAANGISMTAMSISKAFGPAGAGALFSWAQKRQAASFLPGDQMVFFVLNLIQLLGLVLTFKPFLAQPCE
ncbi:hypothetical protein CDL15_Pgr026677 [Punica granatum]|uniref:Major facilitator superfamily (MFS) profile domain-containing protein n=1 Tax=Punica granatum TaxID=22663 RepID=A0A218WM66_PUNGR|nr:hypothetical protein CDL15_Pgr026677 [Punica granatum]